MREIKPKECIFALPNLGLKLTLLLQDGFLGLGPGKVDSFQNTEGNLAFGFDHVLTLRVFIGKHRQEVLFLLSAVRK